MAKEYFVNSARIMERLKTEIRERRRDLHLTQAQVGRSLNKSEKGYQRTENEGVGLSDIFKLLEILYLLEFSTSEIINLLELPPLKPSEIKDICQDEDALGSIQENELCCYIGEHCTDMDTATIASLLEILSIENRKRH